ncbi:methylated-DNA--[protein]-cysteine S-methyltransferase [Schleiferilactobacillus shenzhenensis]|uniref:Methylated-DNA--protein-cysteine methyltransferase n=1 Tax=Schleiferilactobacillus shenzhenensis LY-73 TaxID=1231336 RepID=U4TVT4_9LACO|nr:methylated-DNA--[protein]-cysteine S-methyltransferase [Schleiferilactobacillus shenzhenensis]ERL65953.1 Ogt [Schleiferilactobacillus shenzhenensis LY-73]
MEFAQQVYPSPLGPLTLLSDADAILGLWFADQQHFGAGYDLSSVPVRESTPLRAATAWLGQYFAGERPDPRQVPLHPVVTAFRQRVLAVLETVPYGATITYQEIADRLPGASAAAARAVGGAVGHNPISIIIPCHRVVGRDGSLTGYAGGINRKIALLTLEGHDPERLAHDRI